MIGIRSNCIYFGESLQGVIIKYRTFNFKMAVPKKKKSKSKRNQRHAVWKAKASNAATKALSLGKSVLTGKAQGFVYPIDEEESEE